MANLVRQRHQQRIVVDVLGNTSCQLVSTRLTRILRECQLHGEHLVCLSTQHQNQLLNAWILKFNSHPTWRTNNKANEKRNPGKRCEERDSIASPLFPTNIPHGSGKRVMEKVTPARTKEQREKGERWRGGGSSKWHLNTLNT